MRTVTLFAIPARISRLPDAIGSRRRLKEAMSEQYRKENRYFQMLQKSQQLPPPEKPTKWSTTTLM